jgi:hypothetical protein
VIIDYIIEPRNTLTPSIMWYEPNGREWLSNSKQSVRKIYTLKTVSSRPQQPHMRKLWTPKRRVQIFKQTVMIVTEMTSRLNIVAVLFPNLSMI